MKKRSTAVKLGVAALALTLVTASLSSGTLAKYTTQLTTGAEFTVARWSVDGTVTDGDGNSWTVFSPNEEVTFSKLKNGSTTLQPGDEGYFTIDVSAAVEVSGGTTLNSEVDVNYKVYIKPVKTDGIPAHFKMWEDGAETGILTEDELAVADDVKSIDLTGTYGDDDSSTYGFLLSNGTIAATDTTRTASKKIAWRWPYESSSTTSAVTYDSTDTFEGINKANQEASFYINILMTQKNPNAEATT